LKTDEGKGRKGKEEGSDLGVLEEGENLGDGEV